ncbi:MAG: WYL domain-containing protein [Glaciecola sp.]
MAHKLKKIIRTQQERYEISAEITALVPVGERNKIAVATIINKLSGTHQGNKSHNAFKREVERICSEIHAARYDEDDDSGLIKVGKRRMPVYYFWSDEGEKERAIEFFTITRPRAFALLLVKEHIADILPLSFLNALDSDFKLAEKKFDHDGMKLSDILEYNPFGLRLNKSESYDASQIESMFGFVFDALLSRTTLTFEYSSIHPEYLGKTLYVSGQKLRYINNKLQLQGYEHSTQSIKHFALSKITKVALAPQIPYKNLDATEYESHHILKLKCHTWVKDGLETSRLGSNLNAHYLGDDVWELTENVTFPRHFKTDRPDGFYLANFISMYADSVEVIEPKFLRAEMQRRSNSIQKLYSEPTTLSEKERKQILSDSPQNIANLK